MPNTIAAAQDWSKRYVLEPVENAIKVLTGRAAHNEIKKYILENEAINNALYTRLLEAESRIRFLASWIRWLAVSIAILGVAEVLHWVLR